MTDYGLMHCGGDLLELILPEKLLVIYEQELHFSFCKLDFHVHAQVNLDQLDHIALRDCSLWRLGSGIQD